MTQMMEDPVPRVTKNWVVKDLYKDNVDNFMHTLEYVGPGGNRLTAFLSALEVFKEKVPDPETLFIDISTDENGRSYYDDSEVKMTLRIREYRLETDEELGLRLAAEKEAAAKRSAASRKASLARKKRVEEEERALLAKLKQKYPD
jgi:hypothetical protein